MGYWFDDENWKPQTPTIKKLKELYTVWCLPERDILVIHSIKKRKTHSFNNYNGMLCIVGQNYIDLGTILDYDHTHDILLDKDGVKDLLTEIYNFEFNPKKKGKEFYWDTCYYSKHPINMYDQYGLTQRYNKLVDIDYRHTKTKKIKRFNPLVDRYYKLTNWDRIKNPRPL